ncbi:helix-turn-helix domain-containing protein [Mariprofundus ferrooxydans]|nr:helix-turn-helix domain-containing protein [Mariprofundus ferrooxydans]
MGKKLNINDAGELLSSEEFCSVLSWKKKTLYDRITSGADLPASIKIGRNRYFKKETVLAWLDRLECSTSVRVPF